MRGRLVARRNGTKRNLYRRIADRISAWLILAFGSQADVELFLGHVPEPDESWGS